MSSRAESPCNQYRCIRKWEISPIYLSLKTKKWLLRNKCRWEDLYKQFCLFWKIASIGYRIFSEPKVFRKLFKSKVAFNNRIMILLCFHLQKNYRVWEEAPSPSKTQLDGWAPPRAPPLPHHYPAYVGIITLIAIFSDEPHSTVKSSKGD